MMFICLFCSRAPVACCSMSASSCKKSILNLDSLRTVYNSWQTNTSGFVCQKYLSTTQLTDRHCIFAAFGRHVDTQTDRQINMSVYLFVCLTFVCLSIYLNIQSADIFLIVCLCLSHVCLSHVCLSHVCLSHICMLHV